MMLRFPLPALSLIAALGVTLLAAPAQAAQCGGNFNTFLAAMAREAQAAGISRAVINEAFAGVTQDPKAANLPKVLSIEVQTIP